MTNKKPNIINVIEDQRFFMLGLGSKTFKRRNADLRAKYNRIARRLHDKSEEIAEKLDLCPCCGEERDNFEMVDEGYSQMYDTCPECSYNEYSHSDLADPWDI